MMDMSHLTVKCSESTDFQSYLDGCLPIEECRRLEEHVKHCKRCSEELAALKLTFESLTMELSPDARDIPKAGEIDRLLQVINKAQPLCNKGENTKKLTQWVFPWNLFVGAALAILLFITIWPVDTGISPKQPAIKSEKTQQNWTFTIKGPEKAGLVKMHLVDEIPLQKGVIKPGYTYEVPPQSLATIQLSENLIECYEKTIFVMQSAGMKLFNGKARFSISSRKSTFAVTTPDGAVKCLGTRFTVQTNLNGTLVSLEDGKIEITAGVDKVVQSEPGALYKMSGGRIQKIQREAPVQQRLPADEPAQEAPIEGSFETSY